MQERAAVQASSRVFSSDADSVVLTGSRLLTFEAMHLLISLDRDLREARAPMESGLVSAAYAYSIQSGVTLEKTLG